MFEYIFFDAALRDKFVGHAKQLGIACSNSEDHMGMVVAIPEDLPDELADDMESYYETLEEEQEDISKSEGDLHRLAGFRFNLPDGSSRMVPLQAEIANRLMANFTLTEIQALFEAVADCTVNQNEEHLCKILAAQKDQ
jgi:hypothetical protein